jgi:glycosyltransferase involved in cell wall biosynthesis
MISRDSPLRVGIVANEFFDLRLGRMGGFGWAALHAARSFKRLPGVVTPVFISGEHVGRWRRRRRSNGIPLTLRHWDLEVWERRLTALRLDLLLTIEYRPSYEPVLTALSTTPLLVWVRDPRSPEDDAKIASLELPDGRERPQGTHAIDCRSMRDVVERSLAEERPVAFASTAPNLLAPRARAAYTLPSLELAFLPNPLEVDRDEPVDEPARPTVVFLGRLDPIKRPWLFVELARRFPQADFLMLGQSHFTGDGAWSVSPESFPSNLRLLSHVDGAEKARLLRTASVFVNTAVHEGLPVSFLEALHCGLPILSCQDPEHVVSRFGIYVGRWDGSGLDSLDAFEAGLRRLLTDDEFRRRCGAEGRNWARANHTEKRFVETFLELASGLVAR